MGWVLCDPGLQVGYVRVEVHEQHTEFYMNHDTFLTLFWEDLLLEVKDVLGARGTGTYLIPLSLIDAAAARDLDRALSMMEPEDSEDCTLPTCLQPAAGQERGFPLCLSHAALLQGWDDLTAPLPLV